MQLRAQKIYIQNPTADAINDITTGDFAGELVIDDQIRLLKDSINSCDIECAAPCEEQVHRITFADVDFGDCNDCGKSVGFKIRLDRNPDFDNPTYLDFTQLYTFVYQGNASGSVTAATLATYFEEYINDLKDQADQHDLFGIEVEVDPTDATALLITLPCSGLVMYEFTGIYQLEDNNLTNAELPVFAVDNVGTPAVLSREKLLRESPLMAGHIFGEAPKNFFFWCDNVCVIALKGCKSACADPYEYPNSGHLHTGSTPFDLLLYVNSSAPGYADFIAALNAAVTECTLTDVPGSQVPLYSGAVTTGAGGTVDITNVDFGDGTNDYQLVVGGVTLNVTNVTDGSDLASQLSALTGGAFTFTFAAGPPAVLGVPAAFVAAAAGANTNAILTQVG